MQATLRRPPTVVSTTEERRELVGAYMSIDGTSLPADVPVTTVGCGESFPVEGESDQGLRRVELYFFDRKLGVQPAPPGAVCVPSSPEYPEWVRRAQRTYDWSLLRYAGPVCQCRLRQLPLET